MRWFNFCLVAVCMALALGFVAQTALAAMSVNLNMLNKVARGGLFIGNVTVFFDELSNGSIEAWLDAGQGMQKMSQLTLQDYYNISEYGFIETNFSYLISANGTKAWTEWPDQDFAFTASVSTKCMDGVSETYNITYTNNRVNGSEGLKYIKNLSTVFGLCTGHDGFRPENTTYEITSVSGGDVYVTVRAACGGQRLVTEMSDKDGWIRTVLLCPATKTGQTNYQIAGLRPVNCTGWRNVSNWISYGPNKFGKIANLYLDVGSLSSYRDLYNGTLVGGIYRVEEDGNLTYLEKGIGANWSFGWDENKTGYTNITIYNYDPDRAYIIQYLPYNFATLTSTTALAHVCAYTSTKTELDDDWGKSSLFPSQATTQNGSYAKTFNASDILKIVGGVQCEGALTGCDVVTVQKANATLIQFSAPISFSQSWNGSHLNVSARAIFPKLDNTYNFTLPLSAFEGLFGPDNNGRLEIRIYTNGQLRVSNASNFTACDDGDGDSWCPEMGDCNDTDPTICPGCIEICDGKDNNCNGKIDEEIFPQEPYRKCTKKVYEELVKRFGDVPFTAAQVREVIDEIGLGDWKNNSPCGGYWICAEGRLACNATAKPYELPEICNNSIDDNCNGEVDEEAWIEKNESRQCVCQIGQTAPCGKNIGACKAGIKTCIQGPSGPVWSECKGAIGPKQETCNGIDDDCDGVIDNIGGAVDPSLTKCGCSGRSETEIAGIKSRIETTCNDIDDNCNGEIDEGLRCCRPGQNRSCAEIGYKGICATGIQTCGADGKWGACSVIPYQYDICYNNIDDDCDGVTDNPDYCQPRYTCFNGFKDLNEEGIDCGGACSAKCKIEQNPAFWFSIAFIGILMFAIVGTLSFKGVI
ncbi:MAG: putative metal-binding motif-containing protein [Candidatus Aenigmatarchaeota archaeon]